MSLAPVTLLRAPDRPPTNSKARSPRSRISEGLVVFLLSSAVYLAVAVELVSHHVIYGDALSRVANGFYVLYSRYPHLPAVGFVWNPLPSLVILPLLPLKAVFPILVSEGLAGGIASALFMAGTVVLVGSCLRKLGVSTPWRIVLITIYAVQPIILLYSGSGMSEPMLLFFSLLTTSVMISWAHDRHPGQLVGAGLALALGYMTRYESVGPTFAVMVLVGLVTAAKGRGSWSDRARQVLTDLVLVAGPFFFAFAMWALSAKILVGEWFPTFSSSYGNSAQVSTAKGWLETFTGSTRVEIAHYAAHQLATLVPLLVVVVVIAVAVFVLRRRLADLVAPFVLGGVLGFDNAALLDGKSFGWFRFQIAVVPLVVLLSGTVIAAVQAREWQRLSRMRPGLVMGAVLSVVLCWGIPTQFRALTNDTVHDEGAPMLRALFHPAAASPAEKLTLHNFDSGPVIARYLDALHLKPGSVLTDSAYSYFIILASRDPHQFVITSDLDFKAAVADPAKARISYLLVPANGRSDALEHHWPGLYANGDGQGVLVKQFNGVVFGNWRLYRVNSTR